MKALRASECEQVIVDTTVQEKAIAHPVDSRLLEVARGKVVEAAKQEEERKMRFHEPKR
jgi:IS5 family transposase